jgi:hypothetical protein
VGYWADIEVAVQKKEPTKAYTRPRESNVSEEKGSECHTRAGVSIGKDKQCPVIW